MTETEEPKRTTLSLEFGEGDLAFLAVLSSGWIDDETDDEALARRTLEDLIELVINGVSCPKSWERTWLVRAFGDGWLERLEADPEVPYRQQPKQAGKTPVLPTGQETPGGGS